MTDALIKHAFMMRRKTLINNLSDYGSKEELASYLEEAGLDRQARGETLSAEDFVRLSDVIHSHKNA